MIAWVETVYPVEHVPAGARNARRRLVSDTVPVEIPELSDDDAPVVLRADVAAYAHSHVRLPEVEFRVHAGGLVRKALDVKGAPIGPEALGASSTGFTSSWSSSKTGYPFTSGQVGYVRPGDIVPVGELRIRRTVSSGREAAAAYAAGQGLRSCLIEGAVWVPCSDVTWVVARHHEGGHVVSPEISGSALGVGSARFAAVDLPAAMAHATWMDERAARRGNRAPPAHRNGFMEVTGHYAGSERLAPTTAAAGLTHDVATNPLGADFTSLPLASLRGWMGFREALERLPGDPSAIHDGYEGLRTTVRHAPAFVQGLTAPDSSTWKLRVDVAAMLHHYDTYLADQVPRPDMDEALAAISRGP